MPGSYVLFLDVVYFFFISVGRPLPPVAGYPVREDMSCSCSEDRQDDRETSSISDMDSRVPFPRPSSIVFGRPISQCL